jgi:hypothetical protein
MSTASCNSHPFERPEDQVVDMVTFSGVELQKNLKLALLFGQLRREAPHCVEGPINGDAYVVRLTSG